MTRSSRLSSRRNAFSLAEMLVVLIIIGMLSAVAVPRYAQASARQRLEGAVRRVVTDLNRVSDRARISSTSITVWFDLVTHTYRINAIEDLDHPGNIYTVDLSDEPYQAKIIAADFGGVARLRYDGYGDIVTSGWIDIQVGNLATKIMVGDSIFRVAIPVPIPIPIPIPDPDPITLE